MEQHVVDTELGGVHAGPSLLDYRIPTFPDTPEISSYIVEAADAQGPYGAKEAGEGPLHPIIPAISNALYDAVGVRMNATPFSPPRVLAAIEARRAREKSGDVAPHKRGRQGH
jgi:CO/xanthine dehydrogenase Mo-binding subunit